MDTKKQLAEIAIQLERLANQIAELRALVESQQQPMYVMGEVNEDGQIQWRRGSDISNIMLGGEWVGDES